eukprot:1325344-Amorphochlora_amoeboformis.AAC.1
MIRSGALIILSRAYRQHLGTNNANNNVPQRVTRLVGDFLGEDMKTFNSEVKEKMAARVNRC